MLLLMVLPRVGHLVAEHGVVSGVCVGHGLGAHGARDALVVLAARRGESLDRLARALGVSALLLAAPGREPVECSRAIGDEGLLYAYVGDERLRVVLDGINHVAARFVALRVGELR